jgi:hypothetical protein
VWQHCYCAWPGQACPPQFDLGPIGPELAPGWRIVDSTHVKVHADGSNPVGGQSSQAMGRTKGGLNTRFMLSSMPTRKPSSFPCRVGTKPISLWQKSSRSSYQRIQSLSVTKPIIAPLSERQRPLRKLKPAFLLALTPVRLYHSPQSSTGVVIE